MKRRAALLALLITTAAQAQQADGQAEARANFNRTVVLAADDVRAFPKPPAGFDDANPALPQGQVVEFGYDSAVTRTQRQALVYLPPGYSPQRRYPVLYLLHGIGGNQHEWRGYVRGTAVLDRLLAQGQAQPMIVVMPNGRARADDAPPPAERTFTPDHIAAFASFEADLLNSLIPAIDAKYATLANADHRAIAGLSMGGGQSLNFGLSHRETFAWVGGFSSAPNTRPAAELLHGKGDFKLVYLSCGNRDGLINVSQSMHRELKALGVAHVWNVDEYGHDRESWAENLYHFAQRLFR
ncbi:enterochelin esterase-like enzyme [Pelomonas saccharophila]|uniref:Enterochelin esterase-like enzyme n=1 Tax=Roseateles saccharophilus TaxID=304 RepID=A0ABU1YET2_ROSSA|nr:alpha/beta hydrolase-fold protein [Roseateles saccharophilus]MDR7267375.1 enterochelin esterase-like enzyme [Roseateles saccharophilus]